MTNYVIINGTNSNTITGLAINELPPITKPLMRTEKEEIDGRDGDIITKLGYSAYDKTITIGLWGTGYDVNSIISFFNKEGTITFSNEADKYYNFIMLEQFDIESLLRFKTATITFHCQPFKYPLTETPIEIQYEYIEQDNVESASLNNTNGNTHLDISLKGNTSQTGTPTPTTPQPINVVSGDNTITVCGKNIFNKDDFILTNGFINATQKVFTTNADSYSFTISINPNTTYTISKIASSRFRVGTSSTTPSNNSSFTDAIANDSGTTITITSGTNDIYLTCLYYNSSYDTATQQQILDSIQVELGNQATTYKQFQGIQTYPINLGVENLFDKSSPNYISGFPNDTEIISSGTGKSIYIPIKGGETYTISKMLSARFRYCTTATTPQVGTSVIDYSGNNTATSLTVATSSTANYLVVFYYNSDYDTLSEETIRDSIEIVKGSTPQHTSTTPIELCKIGDYQDYFYKDSGKWYKHSEIGKVELNGNVGGYNSGNNWFYIGLSGLGIATTTNEALCDYFTFYENFTSLGNTTIGIGLSSALTNFLIRNTDLTSENAYKTWLGTNKPIVYYVLATPTNTEITDTTLIGQLDNIQNAMSYEGQTNVSQVNNDKPFIMDLIAMKDGTDEVIVNNIGNTTSKPTIALEGKGDINIYLDGTQMLKATLTDKMTIDTNNLEAYNPDTMTLLNRQLVGDISKFTLASGNNTIKVDGNLTKATITNYTRWL